MNLGLTQCSELRKRGLAEGQQAVFAQADSLSHSCSPWPGELGSGLHAAVPRVLPALRAGEQRGAQGAKEQTCSCPWGKGEAINLFSLLAPLRQSTSNTPLSCKGL